MHSVIFSKAAIYLRILADKSVQLNLKYAIIRYGEPEVILALTSLLCNLQRGYFTVDNGTLAILKRHRRLFHSLANLAYSIKAKRRQFLRAFQVIQARNLIRRLCAVVLKKNSAVSLENKTS
jgi:hypothetical protein